MYFKQFEVDNYRLHPLYFRINLRPRGNTFSNFPTHLLVKWGKEKINFLSPKYKYREG